MICRRSVVVCCSSLLSRGDKEEEERESDAEAYGEADDECLKETSKTKDNRRSRRGKK